MWRYLKYIECYNHFDLPGICSRMQKKIPFNISQFVLIYRYRRKSMFSCKVYKPSILQNYHTQ